MDEFLKYTNHLTNALKAVDQNLINNLKQEIINKFNEGGEIFIIGNGGSAANAHHIAGDYLKTFALLGIKAKISCLSDNSCFLTAASNDLDYSESYEILVNTRIEKKDFLIFLSGSGNSINLIKTATAAKRAGIKTAALIGYSGGGLKKIVDIPLHIEINDMEISEDIQIIIFHYLKQQLFIELSSSSEITPKYNKRVIEDLIA